MDLKQAKYKSTHWEYKAEYWLSLPKAKYELGIQFRVLITDWEALDKWRITSLN